MTESAPKEGEGLIVAAEVLPPRLPIVPVGPRPVFPGFPLPLAVREPLRVAALRRAIEEGHNAVGLVLVRDPSRSDGPHNLYEVGVGGRIVQAAAPNPEAMQVLIQPLLRFVVLDARQTPRGLEAQVQYESPQPVPRDTESRAYAMAIVTALRELMQASPIVSEAIKGFLAHASLDDPGRLADFSATLTSAQPAELQDILATFDITRRMEKVLVLLRREVEVAQLQARITRQIEEKISAQQREYFLREQLRTIKSELGIEKEGKEADVEEFRRRLADCTLNPEAQQAFDSELERFQLLEPNSPEFMVSRTYLDWLSSLPWGRKTTDRFDLDRVRRILDRDHFGLEDVKERILEFIAVGRLKGDISGSILCLVGPPGVGKTSVGRSIAKALGRRFFRFSLGGMRDEAEIKGHRRTYIGAMPGKILQALKTAGSANPVIMLDELDKVGASYRGDPASALLEVLDPEQNEAFRDHYLDVPFDLSNVLFVATANVLDTIPPALLDRMEVIRLAGYIREEKLEIARRYLIPRALEAQGLTRRQVTLRRDAVQLIIDGYAREAGVRGLEKQIRRILRKVALQVASGEVTSRQVIGARRVEDYLGLPVFRDEPPRQGIPGLVVGLAWTPFGGATLEVEATAIPSRRRGFRQTGQLGEVMVESAEIAYSYVMARVEAMGGAPDFFDRHLIHVHVPAGATPKDGPSAGITMATALVSLLKQVPTEPGVAMTGELTLTGRVLPVGGIREKIIAARRVGLRTLLLPEANRRDVADLPDYLRRGLTLRFVRHYDEVLRWAFPG